MAAQPDCEPRGDYGPDRRHPASGGWRRVSRAARLVGTLVAVGSLIVLAGCFGGGGDAAPPKPSELPPPYPLGNGNMKSFAGLPLDESGAIYDPDVDGRHPLTVASYALALYNNYYETGEPDILPAFWAQVNWLRDNFVEVGEFGVWQYPFDYPAFEAKAPWVSAMMQAFGLSVMLKAAALDPEQADAYESIARRAMEAFEVPVADGGVRSQWEDGTVWYEEYATRLNPHVLNGFIFSLAGLHEYQQQTGDEQAARLFAEGIDALKRKLARYDKGFTSAYDTYSNGNAAGRGHYHSLHIQQLLWVYYVTGDTFFWDTAKAWVNYDGWSRPSGSFLKGVEASFDRGGAFAAARLIDNINYYGYWSSNSFPVTIKLDLGQVERNVSQIVFFAVDERHAPGTFTVELSTDGATWVPALAVTDGIPAAAVRGTNQTGLHQTEVFVYRLEVSGDARYALVTIAADRGGRNVALREIQLHFDQTDHTQAIFDGLLPQFDPSRGEAPRTEAMPGRSHRAADGTSPGV